MCGVCVCELYEYVREMLCMYVYVYIHTYLEKMKYVHMYIT